MIRASYPAPHGAVVLSTSIIPPITDPMGAHWDQPDTDNFVIDDTHVIMSERDFKALAEYSTTTPSGVYPGKCWKAQQWEKDPTAPRGWKWIDKWDLRWYGTCEDPKLVTNHHREIIII